MFLYSNGLNNSYMKCIIMLINEKYYLVYINEDLMQKPPKDNEKSINILERYFQSFINRRFRGMKESCNNLFLLM